MPSQTIEEILVELEDEVARLRMMLDRAGMRLGTNANFHGSNWEVSENQIAQWVPGTPLPLGETSEYARFKDGKLEVRGGSLDIKTNSPNDDSLIINENGITLIQVDAGGNHVAWQYQDTDMKNRMGQIYAMWFGDPTYAEELYIETHQDMDSPWDTSQIILRAINQPNLTFTKLYVSSDDFIKAESSVFYVTGNIVVVRSGTNYTGYVFVPLPTMATSTDFDGDLYDVDNDGVTIDLSSKFGLPANIKAVSVALWSTCDTAGKQFALRTNSSTYPSVTAYTQVGGQQAFVSGIVPCDSNGDIYFTTDAVHGHECSVTLRINGYGI